MILSIEIIVLVMTVILMLHSRQQYSASFVRVFWLGGAIMGVLREVAMVGLGAIYTYGDFKISIMGFPLIYIFLFSNLGYISWQWSNNYLQRDYLASQPWDNHLPLVFLTGVFFAFMFETLLSQYHLIDWQVDSVKNLWGNTPLLAPFSYGFTTVVFLMSMKTSSGLKAGKWQLAPIKFVGIQPLVILSVHGILLIINLSIILVYS